MPIAGSFPDVGKPVIASPADGAATFRFPGMTTEWQIQQLADGTLIFASQVNGGGYTLRATIDTAGALYATSLNVSNHAITNTPAAALGFNPAGSGVIMALSGAGLHFTSSSGIRFVTGSNTGGTVDTALMRDAAGVASITTGVAGVYRDLRARSVTTDTGPVATMGAMPFTAFG